MTQIDDAARERRAAEEKKNAFDRWLNEPMVRLGISMIPAGEHQDTLRMLLQSAFEAGFAVGGANIVGGLLDAFISRKIENPKP